MGQLVNSDDANEKDYLFGVDWKPWDYQKRLADVVEVEKVKKVQEEKGNLPQTQRDNVTAAIRALKSCQEFAPLVGEYIDLAKSETLHLKNNVCRELFSKVFTVCTPVDTSIRSRGFTYLRDSNIFVKFVFFVRKKMNCNGMANAIKKWYNENTEKPFEFRFRGQESKMYLHHFPSLISMVLDNTDVDEIDGLYNLLC